jgi:TRAP-type C4-dicarboxylate transport system substrate-binding protein
MIRFSIKIFMLLLFLLSCVFVSTGFAQEKVITLRFSNQFPASSGNSTVLEEWCKEVEKRANGKIKIIYFPGSVLNAPPAMYDSVVQGIADISNHIIGYTVGKFPLTEILDYPLGIPSGYVATKLMNAYYNKFKPKEFDEVKVMYFHGQGPTFFSTRSKPINKLEDIKGLKIRVSGTAANLVTLLGGVPVAMPMQEAYDALSKGVTDGIVSSFEPLINWKIGEVVKYTTETYGVSYTATFVIAMNKSKWATLNVAEQQIIEKINLEWIEKHGKAWDKWDMDGRKFCEKRGNKVIKLSAQENARWKAKAEPMFDEYAKKMKEKDLPGAEVIKFIRDYLKKNPK